MGSYQLVVLRHGESQWNQENRFTGWVDVDLSAKGLKEAQAAGELLKSQGFLFDQAHTSVLRRAIRTLWLTLEASNQMYVPVQTSWRLNERHYGALQGLDKTETANKYGEAQVKIWRRSYDTFPPPMEQKEYVVQQADPRYQSIKGDENPKGETLKSTLVRLLPYWQGTMVPQIMANKKILMVAHGNSIRALVQHLENLTPEQIMEVNIPTGTPLVYKLKDCQNGGFEVVEKKYLGDADAIARAQAAVAAQGSSKR